MKHFLYLVLTFFSTYCLAQKFILVNSNMKRPVTYANTITVLDSCKGYFPIDKFIICHLKNNQPSCRSLIY